MGVIVLSASRSTQEALEGCRDHELFIYVVAAGQGFPLGKVVE